MSKQGKDREGQDEYETNRVFKELKQKLTSAIAIVSCIPSVNVFAFSSSEYSLIPLVLGADCRHKGCVAIDNAA